MKKLQMMFLTILLIVSLLACGKKEVIEETPQGDVVENIEANEGENEVEQQPEENIEIIPENQNLLTGLPTLTAEGIGKRPVAVMVNNVQAALPQYGIEQADVIFEILVEGDQTRFMALYGDYMQVPKICSVRSCRKYFPALSEGFDAVYVHWGMWEDAILPYVNSLNVTRYDGLYNTGGLYGRDQQRLNSGYPLEHTSMFDGTGLPKSMETRGERTELLENKKGTAFLFNGLEEQVKPDGAECTEVEIRFGAVTAGFVYDADSNAYLKKFNGKAQVDGRTQNQLSFTNVFVLETNIGIDENGAHKKVDWTGGGNSKGYYVSNGAVQEIKWSKSSEKDYLKFYAMDGEELSINRGKTYIAINYLDKSTFK